MRLPYFNKYPYTVFEQLNMHKQLLLSIKYLPLSEKVFTILT